MNSRPKEAFIGKWLKFFSTYPRPRSEIAPGPGFPLCAKTDMKLHLFVSCHNYLINIIVILTSPESRREMKGGNNMRGRLWPTQQTQNICITFVQRRPNVFDVGPTLYKCYTNVLRSLGSDRLRGGCQKVTHSQLIKPWLLNYSVLI